MRRSQSVIGFWLFALPRAPRDGRRAAARAVRRASRGRAARGRGRRIRCPRPAARTRTCRAGARAGKLMLDPRANSPWPDNDDLRRPRPVRAHSRSARATSATSRPSPIQEQAIPPLLEGRDVIGQAQTGTGKTAAFGLPMMEYVDPDDDEVQALVLTPTRELCIQVTQALRAYGARKGIDVVAVFGGAPIRAQQAQLRAGRPGRGRHRRPRARPDQPPLADARTPAATSCSTRPTRCSTSASSRTSRRSSRSRPAAARPRCSARRCRRDPHARRAPPVRPGHDQGQGRDADDRHRRAVLPSRPSRPEKPDALVRVLEAERPRPGDRLRAHEDPLRPALPHAARQGHERQGAARRHDPGRARRRDDRLQGRARADPRGHRRRRARPGHLDGHPHRQLRRARPRPTSTCTASAAPAASAARGRAITFVEPRQRRELEAIERHAAREIAPWTEGAHVAPAPGVRAARAATASRTTRADDQRRRYTKLIANAGRREGVEAADLIAAITARRARRRGDPQRPRARALRASSRCRRATPSASSSASPRSTARPVRARSSIRN